eukprot:TRINITY_DN11881_c0_g1_i1.p1 TRINITY_DN11881_c0_g1~~TRINITY_DN11881_c0_g1_i1.p1  ORF type:complete len:503 (-),score=-0.05 TRINITY_DN11881_c0_g1_i1:36-1418(-)
MTAPSAGRNAAGANNTAAPTRPMRCHASAGDRPAAAAAAAAASVSAPSSAAPTAAEIMAIEKDVVVQTYGRTPLVVASGQGSLLYDLDGREFIDMASGIAVNALGHGDSDWLVAVTHQAATLAHVSNLYYTVPMVQLAQQLVAKSFADRVFFVNSGTEANEAAIKFARKYQLAKQQAAGGNPTGGEGHATEFVAFGNCFHGRTMGALALTSKVQYRTPFEPLMPGVAFAEYGDLDAARAAIVAGRTAAVFVEPVQGEGGVYAAGSAFLEGLRRLCDDAGALLVFDEIQCGLGRTGHLWAHEPYGVTPDIMTLAKPLAGGLPIGAVLVTNPVAAAMSPGDHGSTFAGNPLVCRAALAVLNKIAEPAFLASVEAKGELLRKLLRERLGSNPHVKEVRGKGLIVGVQLDVPAGPLVDAAREAGVLVITAGKGDVVRLVPPLVITEEEIERAVDGLVKGLSALG